MDLATEIMSKLTDKEVTEVKEEQPVVPCRRCGRLSAAAPIELSEEAKKEYFRCMLGQRRYTKTVELFDGTVSVTFEEPTVAIQRRLESLKNLSISEATDANLIGMLAEIQHVDQETGTATVVYKASPEDRLRYLGDPSTMMSELTVNAVEMLALRRVNEIFLIVLGLLSSSVLSSDFFKGVGLS